MIALVLFAVALELVECEMHEENGLVGRVAQTVGQHADVLLHMLVEECAHRLLVGYLHAEETVGLRRLLFGSDEQRTVEKQA